MMPASREMPQRPARSRLDRHPPQLLCMRLLELSTAPPNRMSDDICAAPPRCATAGRHVLFSALCLNKASRHTAAVLNLSHDPLACTRDTVMFCLPSLEHTASF